MKIVLSHGYFLYADPKEQVIMRPYPPLGILYLSAYLKQHHLPVSVIDSTFMDVSDWKTQLLTEKPDLLALYTNLMTKVQLLALVPWVRENLPKTRLVAGGPDVTYNTEAYLRAGFDFCISGEGEQTLLELVEALRTNGDYQTIPGISYLYEGAVNVLIPREKVRELSELPQPDRIAIPIEKYLDTWKKHHGKRTLNISTQRGCPYTCKWCSTAVYGQSYRRNSPENVVQEIEWLIQTYQVEALWFVDDVFTVSHKWLSELHQLFLERQIQIDFEIITRAERLNEQVLLQLKEMGCFRIWIGAESGSQQIIDRMDRRVKLETVQSMMQQTRKFGMEAGTFIMVGYPGETKQDIFRTLEHIRACNPHLLTVTKTYPIKGTALFEEVRKEIISFPEWNTSTDRDLDFKRPYSSRFYHWSVRYLVNGWLWEKDGSWKNGCKMWLLKQLMKWSS